MPLACSMASCCLLYKITAINKKERDMIRIVCPHCHAPLSTAELEQATIAGQLSLICPECSSVLLSEPDFAEEFERSSNCGMPTRN